MDSCERAGGVLEIDAGERLPCGVGATKMRLGVPARAAFYWFWAWKLVSARLTSGIPWPRPLVALRSGLDGRTTCSADHSSTPACIAGRPRHSVPMQLQTLQAADTANTLALRMALSVEDVDAAEDDGTPLPHPGRSRSSTSASSFRRRRAGVGRFYFDDDGAEPSTGGSRATMRAHGGKFLPDLVASRWLA